MPSLLCLTRADTDVGSAVLGPWPGEVIHDQVAFWECTWSLQHTGVVPPGHRAVTQDPSIAISPSCQAGRGRELFLNSSVFIKKTESSLRSPSYCLDENCIVTNTSPHEHHRERFHTDWFKPTAPNRGVWEELFQLSTPVASKALSQQLDIRDLNMTTQAA